MSWEGSLQRSSNGGAAGTVAQGAQSAKMSVQHVGQACTPALERLLMLQLKPKGTQ